jgi:hypothetical protein
MASLQGREFRASIDLSNLGQVGRRPTAGACRCRVPISGHTVQWLDDYSRTPYRQEIGGSTDRSNQALANQRSKNGLFHRSRHQNRLVQNPACFRCREKERQRLASLLQIERRASLSLRRTFRRATHQNLATPGLRARKNLRPAAFALGTTASPVLRTPLRTVSARYRKRRASSDRGSAVGREKAHVRAARSSVTSDAALIRKQS